MRYPLHLAAKRGDLTEVKQQIEVQGLNPDEQDDEYSRTPVMFAVESKHFDVVQYLLDLETVDASQATSDRWTLLHLSVRQGSFDITQILLEGKQASRVDINAQNSLGATPLHVAVRFCPPYARPEIVQLLLAHGASASLRDNFNVSASRLAASSSQIGLLNSLVSFTPVPCPPRLRPSRLLKSTTDAREVKHRYGDELVTGHYVFAGDGLHRGLGYDLRPPRATRSNYGSKLHLRLPMPSK